MSTKHLYVPKYVLSSTWLLNFGLFPSTPHSHHMDVMNTWSPDKTMNVWTMNVEIEFCILLCWIFLGSAGYLNSFKIKPATLRIVERFTVRSFL